MLERLSLILGIFSSTRGPHNLRKRVFQDATDGQTSGHRDSMAESAQCSGDTDCPTCADSSNNKKIPHTGDKASLDRCG